MSCSVCLYPIQPSDFTIPERQGGRVHLRCAERASQLAMAERTAIARISAIGLAIGVLIGTFVLGYHPLYTITLALAMHVAFNWRWYGFAYGLPYMAFRARLFLRRFR